MPPPGDGVPAWGWLTAAPGLQNLTLQMASPLRHKWQPIEAAAPKEKLRAFQTRRGAARNRRLDPAIPTAPNTAINNSLSIVAPGGCN